MRAVIDATLDCCGEHIKRREQGLDLYEALRDAQVKLTRLSQARQAHSKRLSAYGSPDA